ncbi:MAG: LytR/AlgR family response regulator transcription factor [Candidatus Acidiferrales bacterium]
MPEAISALIVDDEKPAREELAFLLKSFPEIAVIGQARNGLEALNLIKDKSPDLVFLDVEMPGLDGFAVLRKLVDRKVKLPHVIFATAYDHYAVQAFEVNAVDYLLKPFDKARVGRALARARQLLAAVPGGAQHLDTLLESLSHGAAPPTKLLLKTSQRLLLIDSNELVFATIEDGTITLATRELEGTSNYRTLEDLQETLDPRRFWRVHRSYVVNVNHIKEVVPWFKSSYQLRLNDRRGSTVPVSRAQTRRLREFLNL